MPSIAQMINRAQGIHRSILRGVADGTLAHVTAQLRTTSDVLGYKRARATLLRWNAIDVDGRITETGVGLLAALDQRARRSA